MVVPSRAKSSIRRFIVSSGTGLEKSSYSLQYLQARLQRRMGMMCAMMGWSVEANPLAIILNSRIRRFDGENAPAHPCRRYRHTFVY